MNLSSIEQETIINYNQGEAEATVFTYDKALIRKLERLREKNPAVELLIPPPLDASFPSGHTAASFAAVFALRGSGSPLWKPALAVAILIAFSRLYLYVHYPTDVIFSVFAGILFAFIGDALAAKVAPKLPQPKHGKYETR